jgi:hypothetical protein
MKRPRYGYVGVPGFSEIKERRRNPIRSWLLGLLGREDYVAILTRAQAMRTAPIKGGVSRKVMISIDEPHRRGISAAARKLGFRLDPRIGKPYLLYVGLDNSDGIATSAANSIVAALRECRIQCDVYFEVD